MTSRSVVRASLLAALVGLALLFAGLFVDPDRAWFAYLTAWTCGVSICIGALILLMVGHAAKASWMVVTRRIAESAVSALPLYVVLFVPICFALGRLYPWAAPSGALDPALRHAIEHKRAWLNVPFFVVRSFLYLLEFVVLGTLLRAWSRSNDAVPRMPLVRRMRALSGGAMPLVALTLTWASFDWTMSLEPDWYSTIFGLYVFAGAFVGAIALVAVLMSFARLRAEPELRITPDHAQALGRVLFAMIVFWAYMAFSQLLVYWIGDIPDDIRFYRLRTAGTWTDVTYLLACGQFVVPFFALLNRHWKRDPAYLATVGVWVLMMHFVDVYWLVMPLHDRAGFRPHWLDLGAILLVGGLSCAWIVRAYLLVFPLPRHDPELAEGLNYEAAP